MKRLVYLMALLCSAYAFAGDGGFYLGQTRIVFPSDKKSISLQVTNNGKKDWLLRSWVGQYDDKDKTKTPFIITPPLYRLDGSSSTQLRINAVNISKLPTDRESVYRINVMAIPPESKSGTEDNKVDTTSGSIQFALNSRIKLFYRPAALNNPAMVDTAWQKLTARQQGNMLIISNPTPYYITLAHIKINGIDTNTNGLDTMVAPDNNLKVPVSGRVQKFGYRTINDYGGLTAERTVTL
ncbi:molecular chaperone [Salmonella enterica]|uniref:Molecular chaperone n=1 Tax=Salmonella enterica TaxID=28901 RepID=A0A3J0P8T9_SALER|nr:molecular chaperone [Salmonella enterica]ECU4767642.1 molecular chaperone [Salmonella enterica subsp. enterica]EDQ1016654.1 molecular chaperone [Salmonella enterica subsp. houtenae serovar 50:z4,z23:-]EDV3252244.1 molecular chaperone [Salmonella enterica subsp. houtenae]EDW0440279.1 molecular chaperone [Salmonella enterica subsp. arizonae serovar 50:z4,z23:-]HAE7875209.1 molecular chaperone [Salmonella enterica subsp. enterica serovar 1,9,12:-:-]